MRRVKIGGILGLSVLMTACVQIPSEAPGLSTELGHRLNALEQTHLTLLHRFFDDKRHEVNRYIDEVWLPKFATQFFEQRSMANAWDIIVRENDKDQRLKYIVTISPKLQKAISDKRMSLMTPLNELERALQQAISAEYQHTKAINHTLTSYLYSASKVEANRERYMDKVGVSQHDISNLVTKTDTVVANLVENANTLDEKGDVVKEYADKLEQIQKEL